MSDEPTPELTQDNGERPKGLFAQHPRLGIWVIAGMFYLLLFGMCAFVLVIILQDRS
jgi:hypothetical protein